MRDAMRGVGYVVRVNWSVAKGSFATAVVLTVALSLVPGLQVLVVATLVERLDGDATLREVVGPLVAVAAIVALVGPVRGVMEILRQQADDIGAATTVSALARRAAHTPPRELARRDVLAELERHNETVWQVVQGIPMIAFWAVQHILSTAAVIVAIAVFSPLAALLTGVSLVPALLGGRWLGQRTEEFWDTVGAMFARERYLTGLLVRQRSAQELATLGAGPGVADEARTQWFRYIAARRTLHTAQLRVDWVTGLVGLVCVIGALVALLVDTALAPVAVAGVMGVIAGAGSVAAAGGDLGRLLSYGPVAARLRDFLEDEVAAVPSSPVVPVDRVDRIAVDGLTHTYADRDAAAVDDVGFTARRGEVIALVGANGAGKTTAVRALLGLIEPDAGTVRADGIGPADVDDRDWLARFGVLVQEYERYELTVRENLVLGLTDEVADERLWAALELAGLDALVRSLPDQLDAQLGEQWEGTQLSGGQWQRLALARVAVRDAPVWVLDEPTSAVDAESEEAVVHRLVRERGERITVLVSHRAWTLREVDRIYVLDDGRVVEQGRYVELLARPGSRFGELFRNQLGPSDRTDGSEAAVEPAAVEP